MTIRKPWGHIAQALAMQILLGLLFGNWWAGVLAGTCWFIARELAQAEYRWIEAYGFGRRANLPWWGCFDRRVWKRSDLIDFFAPFAATVLTAALITAIRGLLAA